MNPTRAFHILSYLQYPLMLIALYYALSPYWNDFQVNFKNIDRLLIFMGLSISFSTLQDTQKTQNKLSLKVWQSPRKGKLFLALICLSMLVCFAIGLVGYLMTEDHMIKEISSGLIILGIGMVGLLKAATEMFENHRRDKRALSDQ